MQMDEELIIMSDYKITPNELYLIHALLRYVDDINYITKYIELCKTVNVDVRSLLISLQDKGIILKAYKIPEKGTPFKPEEVLLNQNFIKKYYKASFELGQELFDCYPQFCEIQGVITPIRGVSKKFDSLEDFFRFYGKSIKYNPNLHNHIIELITWAKNNTNVINTTLANFVIDKRWLDLEALRNGDNSNINFDTVKVL